MTTSSLRTLLAALLALAACTPAPRTAAPLPPPPSAATPSVPAERTASAPSVTPATPAPAQPSSTPAKPSTTPPPASGAPAKSSPPRDAKAAAPKAPPPVAKAPATPSPPATAAAAPSAPAIPPAPLDIKSLEQRLRETAAIGVMTKLSLKNQVDDLLQKFREYHRGQLKASLAELRRPYELLLMKVLSLLQDSDPSLARDINASREAIWSVLTDRQKFSQFT